MQMRIFWLVQLLFVGHWVVEVLPARLPPREVPPVTSDDNATEFRASLWAMNIGTVDAWDTATHTQLWKRRLYEICYCLDVETDIQWVFIDGLELRAGELWVSTELGSEYALDPRSLRVKLLEPGRNFTHKQVSHFVGDSEPQESACDVQRKCARELFGKYADL